MLSIESDTEGADFSRRRLTQLAVSRGRFTACRFERMRVDVAFLGNSPPSTFVECSFDRSKFGILFATMGRFERCTFRDVRIGEWRGDYAELVDCVFTGQIKRGMFWGRSPNDAQKHLASQAKLALQLGLPPSTDDYVAVVNRAGNEFTGNDFSGADLGDVSFRNGIDLSAQRLPEGGDYLYVADAAAAVERARRQVGGWGDESRRSWGLQILDRLGQETAAGQRQLLLRAAHYFPRRPQDWVDDLFALLRPVAD